MTLVHNKPPRYHAYMLRFWEVRSEHPGRPSTWRFSLENAQTGQKRGFPDLEELLTFLKSQLKQIDNEPAELVPMEE